MNSKDIVTLLQKVGVAAMMQEPPIVVENLRDVLMSIDVSNITTYLSDVDAQNVNCAAAIRGLEELSGRYFRNQSRYKSLSAEAVDIFFALPQKHAVPKTTPTTAAIVKPSASAPVAGRSDNRRKATTSNQHVATGRVASPPVDAPADAAAPISAVDTSYQLRDTDHRLHQPLRPRLRPMDASAARDAHILDELQAIDLMPVDVVVDEQHPIEFSAIQLYDQQLLAESLVPPCPFVEDGDFGETHPPVVVDPAIESEVAIDTSQPALDEPPPAASVAPAPPGSPAPVAMASPTQIHPRLRQRRRRLAATDPNYRQPWMPPMRTIEDMQTSVVDSIHRELAMRQLTQQARCQETVVDGPVSIVTTNANAEAAPADFLCAEEAVLDARVTTVTSDANANTAVADSVRAGLCSSAAANGTTAFEPAQLSVANSMTPLICITFADDMSLGQLEPSLVLVPSPQLDVQAEPQLPASMQHSIVNQYAVADAILSPSMQTSHVLPMMTSTPSRSTRSTLARELFAAQSPLPQPMLAAMSPLPLALSTLSPLPPVRRAALSSLPPIPAPIATRSTANKTMIDADNAQQRSVLQPIDIELVGPTTAPQLLFGNVQTPCGGDDEQWQRSSVKRVCRALRSAEVPLRARSLIRRSTRLRQSCSANAEEPRDGVDVSARQAFHTICNLHNKRVLKVRTTGDNSAFDNVSLD